VFSHPDFGASAGWSPPTSGSPGAASEGTYYFTLAIPLAPGVTLQVEDVTGVRPVTPEGGWAYLSGSIALLR
jgi:hypothetical protein